MKVGDKYRVICGEAHFCPVGTIVEFREMVGGVPIFYGSTVVFGDSVDSEQWIDWHQVEKVDE